jgi:hypothetical protein
MAELSVVDGELVLHLSGLEKAEAAHGDLRVPVSAVLRAEVLDDAHAAADDGFKLIGTGLPRVVEVGIYRAYGGRKVFAAVHRDTPRGVRVLLEGCRYDEWIVGCADPEGVIAGLGLPPGPGQ